jgi:hypothetical protein
VGDVVFNVSKGVAGTYYGLPAATDSIIIVPIEASGIVADATMQDYADLATLLAGASNEQTTMGRKTAASVTFTVDQANDRADGDFADVTWSAATGNAIAALVVCYVPSSGAADSAIIPITKHDFAVTPDGTDVTATLPVGGNYRAS